MAEIKFREDLVQNTNIADLNAIKVNLTTYNVSMNEISNSLISVRDDFAAADAILNTKINDDIATLAAGAVATNASAISLLNADGGTVGSVDNKIGLAVTAMVDGAPEAYDTLQELLTLINDEDTDLNGLISQLNAKVDAIVAAASVEWNTLEKIEVNVLQIKSDLEDAIANADSGVTDAIALIPHYKYDSGLGITRDDADNNCISLSLIPVDDIIGGKATVYSTDVDGNIIIETINTITLSTADGAGPKDFFIESTEDLSAFQAIVEFFYNTSSNN